MLIPFRSKAAGEFYMMDNHVQVLFSMMDKPFTAQGIIQADEISMRLAQLQIALTQALTHEQNEDSPNDTTVESSFRTVGLKQRAWPLIDMLSKAEKKKVDVIWGSTI